MKVTRIAFAVFALLITGQVWAADERLAWSFGTGTFSRSGNIWTEINQEQFVRDYEEVGRTDQYIELRSLRDSLSLRLYAGRSYMWRNGQWQYIANGQWLPTVSVGGERRTPRIGSLRPRISTVVVKQPMRDEWGR